MVKTLYLYSPVHPIKSGTAHYFGLFMNQLNQTVTADYAVRVVIDKKFYSPAELEGAEYELVDYHEVQRSSDDITIYFLANNEFHRYAHRALYDHRKSDGLAVSVVHEPSMWMNVEAMCNLREYGLNEHDLEYFARYEFGDEAPFFSKLFHLGQTDKNFVFTSLAGTHIYERSDIIVFHSHFARNKFIMEKSATYQSGRKHQPLCLVMEHPPENMPKHITSGGAPKDLFVAGTYGWVKRSKQVEALIDGFGIFYDGLSVVDKAKVALHIVGEIDGECDFYPVRQASASVARDRITFFGYVSNERLDELMSQCSLLFSLRFPSCGETSGPLNKANALHLPVVLSDYAAFAEEPSSYHISVEPKQQLTAIVDLLRQGFERFKTGETTMTAPTPARLHVLKVGNILDKVLAFSDNGGQ